MLLHLVVYGYVVAYVLGDPLNIIPNGELLGYMQTLGSKILNIDIQMFVITIIIIQIVRYTFCTPTNSIC